MSSVTGDMNPAGYLVATAQLSAGQLSDRQLNDRRLNTTQLSTTEVGPDDPGVAVTDIATFLRMHLPALMRYGIALTGNPHDGSDLVQSACEKLALHWTRISANGSPLGYLKVVMANARVSGWRKRRRESLFADMPDSAVVDGYPTETNAIWGAVAELPKKQRAVIVLRYVEGHSEAEIAALLGISVGTVKSHASRAIGTLRRTAPTFTAEAGCTSTN